MTTQPTDMIAPADVWTVLDQIARTFVTDPTATHGFDPRLVARTIALVTAHRPRVAEDGIVERDGAWHVVARMTDGNWFVQTFPRDTSLAEMRAYRDRLRKAGQ